MRISVREDSGDTILVVTPEDVITKMFSSALSTTMMLEKLQMRTSLPETSLTSVCGLSELPVRLCGQHREGRYQG